MSDISLMPATVSLQVLPWVPMEDLYPVVDEVLAYIASVKDIKYEVGAFETVMEGDFPVLMDIVREAVRIAWAACGQEVFAVVKIMLKPEGIGCSIA